MADYKVDVDVNVNDSKLDELESRIKSIQDKTLKVKVDVDSNEIDNLASSISKNMKTAGKNIKITPTVDASGVGKQVSSAFKDAVGKNKDSKVNVEADIKSAVNNMSSLNNVVEESKHSFNELGAASKQASNDAATSAKATEKAISSATTKRQKLIDTYKAEKQSQVDVDSKYNKINNPTEELTAAYNSYKNAKKNLFDTENFTDDVVAVNQYSAALETVKNQLSIVSNKEKEAASAAKAEASAQKEAAAAMQLRSKANNLSLSMDAWLKRNSAAAKTFGGQIRSLQAELKSCDATRFSGIQSEFKTITTQAEIVGKTGMSMGDRLKMQFTKLSSYFGAASVMMTGMQAAREAFQNVLDVDTKMTELKRVTDYTTSQYSDVYDNLVSSAQKYGSTLTDLISQTADWSRAGFNDPDTASRLSEITSVYQHIADLDANTSMENLLTAYKGFETQLDKQYSGDAAAATEHIADVYNEIDNNYATTAADIGEAVKRSASALSLAGNSLEETAG